MSAARCPDADSGSAAGYRASVSFTPRGGPADTFTFVAVQPFAVEADGSWSVTVTVAQPLPPGPTDLVALCFADPADFADHTPYEAVTSLSPCPPLTGIEVQRNTISVDFPCDNTPLGSAFLYDGDQLVTSIEGTVDEAATTATFTVPAEVPSGTYQFQVQCFAPRVGPSAAFGATVQYIASAAPTPEPEQPDTPASPSAPAAPVAGTELLRLSPQSVRPPWRGAPGGVAQ